MTGLAVTIEVPTENEEREGIYKMLTDILNDEVLGFSGYPGSMRRKVEDVLEDVVYTTLSIGEDWRYCNAIKEYLTYTAQFCVFEEAVWAVLTEVGEVLDEVYPPPKVEVA